MSLPCQLEMTLPGGIPGVFRVTIRLMSDGELTQLFWKIPHVIKKSGDDPEG